MKKIGLFVIVFPLIIFGCNKNDGDIGLVLSTDLLQQTSWSGNCTYGDIIDNFDIIFVNDERGNVLYDFHLDQPSEHNIKYTIENGKLLTIVDVPNALHRLYGDWIIDEIKGDYMRFFKDNYADSEIVPVLELRIAR